MSHRNHNKICCQYHPVSLYWYWKTGEKQSNTSIWSSIAYMMLYDVICMQTYHHFRWINPHVCWKNTQLPSGYLK
jgi:hypothetical protein